MNNETNIPDGWSIPDDLANQVNKALNRKSITPEQELQDALDDMARDIALIELNPEDWGWWVTYLLEQMEDEAKRRGKQVDFDEMLKSFQQDIGKHDYDVFLMNPFKIFRPSR